MLDDNFSLFHVLNMLRKLFSLYQELGHGRNLAERKRPCFEVHLLSTDRGNEWRRAVAHDIIYSVSIEKYIVREGAA